MQLMRPRVYKKHADSIVFASANAILVMVLVVGTCWEATAGSQVRPAALHLVPSAAMCFASPLHARLSTVGCARSV